MPKSHLPTSEPIHIHTDGACKGNPGGIGGWGAVLTNYEWIKEIHGGELDTTNNRMELMAVIKALEYLNAPANVVVYTDSTYVQKGISQWIHGWKRNGWKTAAKQPVKNADLWKALDKAQAIHHVEWKWVKGHNGDLANERADALANKGVESVRP